MSLKETFFAALQPERKRLDILPEGLLVRALTSAERATIKSLWLQAMGGGKTVTALPKDIEARTVLYGLINEDGSQALSESDLQFLLTADGGKVGQIYAAVNELSAMSESSAEQAEKN